MIMKDLSLLSALNDASLDFADLRFAFMRDTDLTGANLSNADPGNAIMDGANLQDVLWDNTTCPDETSSDIDDGDDFSCENNL